MKKALLLAALLLSACNSHQAGSHASVFRCSGGWFIPPSFHGNPWSQGGDGSHLAFIYEPMFLYQSATGEYIPQLGQSYSLAPDRRSLTIKLRPEAKWQDGRPFVANDVKSTFLLYWLQGWSGTLASIETPDAHTVKFVWHRPMGVLEQRQVLGRRILAPAHLYGQWTRQAEPLLAAWGPLQVLPEKTQAQEDANQKLLLQKTELMQQVYAYRPPLPVGTNAYTLRKVTASELVLERAPSSWHHETRVDEVHILRGSTNDVMWAYLLGGDIDASHAATPPDVAAQILKLNPDIHLINLPDYAGFGYVFNLRKAPLKDLAMRQAIARVLDRDVLRMVASYYSITSDNYHLPLMQKFRKDWVDAGLQGQLQSYDRDPAAAEKRLKQAGYQRGGDGVWQTPAGQPIHFEIAAIAGNSDWILASEAAATQLTHFGLPTKVRTYDEALYHQLLRQGSFDIAGTFGLDFHELTHPAISLDRFFSKAGYISAAAGLPPRLRGPDGQVFELQRSVDAIVNNTQPNATRHQIQNLLWLANHELPFLAVYEKQISVFVLDGTDVRGWPAPQDPIWSLSSQSMETVYAYLLGSGRLQPVAPQKQALAGGQG